MDTKIESKKNVRKQDGFTLIEILVVIGLIALLAAIVIIAINPARQFAQGRDSQRESNVNSIINAIGQRLADGKGTFDGTFTAGGASYTCPDLPAASTTVDIVYSGSASGTINLSCLVPTYISKELSDPKPGTSTGGYELVVDNAGRVTVKAPSAETRTIEITR